MNKPAASPPPNATRLVVPISIVVASIMLTVSVLYGLDARIEWQVEKSLQPIRESQRDVMRKLDEVRESVARIEGKMSSISDCVERTH